jgi:hypothetical protein
MLFKKSDPGHPVPSASDRAVLLQHLIDQAQHFQGLSADQPSPVALARGEMLLFVVEGAYLIETRRGPGHWQGRTQGLSVPIPGLPRVRYRIGATHGTYVQGEERPTPIDIGSFSITTTRAVFVGPKQTREWSWSKLIAITHDANSPWSTIAVSNRQKTSGVLYDTQHADIVRFYLDLAIAIAHDDRASLVEHLTAELNDVLRQLPPPPAPSK